MASARTPALPSSPAVGRPVPCRDFATSSPCSASDDRLFVAGDGRIYAFGSTASRQFVANAWSAKPAIARATGAHPKAHGATAACLAGLRI